MQIDNTATHKNTVVRGLDGRGDDVVDIAGPELASKVHAEGLGRLDAVGRVLEDPWPP